MDLFWQSNVCFLICWLVITFLPRSKHVLISCLQLPFAVILEPPKIKSDTVSTVSPSISHEVMGPETMILVFWMLSFKPNFSLSSFTFIKRLFSSSSLSAIRVVSYAYLRLLIFLLAILIPACASRSPAFLMMYSAYKLNICLYFLIKCYFNHDVFWSLRSEWINIGMAYSSLSSYFLLVW